MLEEEQEGLDDDWMMKFIFNTGAAILVKHDNNEVSQLEVVDVTCSFY